MSVRDLRRKVNALRLHRREKIWFPKWFEQYATFVNSAESASVPLEIHSIVAFSRLLLKRDKPA